MLRNLPWSIASLWFASVVLSGVLVFRLTRNKLYRRYPAFYAYWVLDIVILPILSWVDPVDRVVFVPVMRSIGLLRCLLFAMMAGELAKGILLSPPTGSISRGRVVLRALGGAILGTSLTCLFDFRWALFQSITISLNWLTWLERTVHCCALLFLLPFSLHVVASALKSNLLYHYVLLTGYAFWKTTVELIHTTLQFRHTDLLSALLLIGASVFQLLWVFYLTERGEQPPSSTASVADHDAEAVLTILAMLPRRLKTVATKLGPRRATPADPFLQARASKSEAFSSRGTSARSQLGFGQLLRWRFTSQGVGSRGQGLH